MFCIEICEFIIEHCWENEKSLNETTGFLVGWSWGSSLSQQLLAVECFWWFSKVSEQWCEQILWLCSFRLRWGKKSLQKICSISKTDSNRAIIEKT